MTSTEIEQVFHHCFAHTRLMGGAREPLYLPGTEETPARIYYREDFAASALHEVAHWCIAGAARRAQVDFGYAYLPPPRDQQTQHRFFKLELKAQALESVFAQAAGVRFHISADNPEPLDMDAQTKARAEAKFAHQLAAAAAEARQWLLRPAGRRAGLFYAALNDTACSNGAAG